MLLERKPQDVSIRKSWMDKLAKERGGDPLDPKVWYSISGNVNSIKVSVTSFSFFHYFHYVHICFILFIVIFVGIATHIAILFWELIQNSMPSLSKHET